MAKVSGRGPSFFFSGFFSASAVPNLTHWCRCQKQSLCSKTTSIVGPPQRMLEYTSVKRVDAGGVIPKLAGATKRRRKKGTTMTISAILLLAALPAR